MARIFFFGALFMICSRLAAQTNYQEISLPQLMKKMQNGAKDMVLVDVRTRGEYADTASVNKQANIGRIKGAINIVLQDLEENPQTVKQLDQYKDKPVYLICSHSYRSRAASEILLRNGFTQVNNVRGGMTDWYRRSEELMPYRTSFLEWEGGYNNMSPAELYGLLDHDRPILLVGVTNKPRFYYDSFNIQLNRVFPVIKKAVYLAYGDSLQLLELARRNAGNPIVLFNMVNNGAAEMAAWLAAKGVANTNYLVGGHSYFYEYLINKHPGEKARLLMEPKSNIRFLTAPALCTVYNQDEKSHVIDIRHDTMFTAIREGVKYHYSHLKKSENFYEGRGVEAFIAAYPDQSVQYILLSQNGIDGLSFAQSLAAKGYSIGWVMGGIHRWEWYMNNDEHFDCMDGLVTQ